MSLSAYEQENLPPRRRRPRQIPLYTHSELGLEMARRVFKANPMNGLSVDNPDDMRLFNDLMDALVTEVMELKAF